MWSIASRNRYCGSAIPTNIKGCPPPGSVCQILAPSFAQSCFLGVYTPAWKHNVTSYTALNPPAGRRRGAVGGGTLVESTSLRIPHTRFTLRLGSLNMEIEPLNPALLGRSRAVNGRCAQALASQMPPLAVTPLGLIRHLRSHHEASGLGTEPPSKSGPKNQSRTSNSQLRARDGAQSFFLFPPSPIAQHIEWFEMQRERLGLTRRKPRIRKPEN